MTLLRTGRDSAIDTQLSTSASDLPALLAECRQAQCIWADRSLKHRLQIVRRVRDQIATNGLQLLDRFPASLERARADSLSAEVLPLAEACRFLELEASSVLASRRLSNKGRPFWLRGVAIEIRREPFGVVLVIGPSNYPLFLPAVQAMQALVAGNAVVVKPGRGGAPVLRAFTALTENAGLPASLLTVLDEPVEIATAAIRSGVDKVILTGSIHSGIAVLHEAANKVTPAIMELSGDDAVFVRADADLDRAVAAISFGLRLNGGETCIAPRRIFVHRAVGESFRRRLDAQRPHGSISITTVEDDEEALRIASESPYALGATVFGAEAPARTMAAKIRAGIVVVNDVIVPTADPRASFGGRALSGFGTTRGVEGLLQMTTPKTVVVQRARRLRHLEPQPSNAEELFLAYLSAKHRAGRTNRWNGWRNLFGAIRGARKIVHEVR